MNPLRIRIEREYPVSVDRLYRAWTEPAALACFAWGSLGREAIALVDQRAGGRLSVSTLRADGERWSFEGEYSELLPGRRLAHSLHWKAPVGYDPVPEQVVIDFAGDGERSSLVFQHDGGFSDAAADGHRAGWTDVLDRLADCLAAPTAKA